jgi:protein tyrosine phosphatase type 4A
MTFYLTFPTDSALLHLIFYYNRALKSTSYPTNPNFSMAYTYRSSSSKKTVPLPNPPTLIEYQGMRFVIMDAPSDANLPLYLNELEKYNVKELVRVCNPTYSKATVEEHHIRVHEMSFPDGESPPLEIIHHWLALVSATFKQGAVGDSENIPAIAIHCIAGLGR